jgi:Fic family protein
VIERTTQRLVNKQYRVDCTPTWFASTIKKSKKQISQQLCNRIKDSSFTLQRYQTWFYNIKSKKVKGKNSNEGERTL